LLALAVAAPAGAAALSPARGSSGFIVEVSVMALGFLEARKNPARCPGRAQLFTLEFRRT